MPTPTRRFLRTHVTWWQAILMFLVLLLANWGVQHDSDSTIKSYSDQNRAEATEQITTKLEDYSDSNRRQIETILIEICERNKADRIDNARAWTQAEETWTERSLDPALSPRERETAHQASVIYAESANQLRARLFQCGPLIRRDVTIIDQAALSETQGEL